MELIPQTDDLLASYLAPFLELAGDRRTAASESLLCSRIAAFSPCAGGGTA